MNHRLTIALLLLSTGLAAQHGVRLTRVPESVRLPAPAGTNLLVEVEVDGSPDAVWFATDRAAVDRVPLAAGSAGRHQGNLADAAVADLLPANRDSGELFVFARHGDRVDASAAIAWTRGAAGRDTKRCVLRLRGGASRMVPADETVWIDPASLERIELQGSGARQATAVVRFDDVEIPLVRRRGEEAWVLDVDGAVRERMHGVRTFEIESRSGGTGVLHSFRCVPAVLHLDATPAVCTVQQRTRAFLPGSDEWLQIRIDDISMGRVQFELVAADGTAAIERRIVRERDHLEFALAGQRYTIVVAKLHNSLLGQDHAEFTVAPSDTVRPDRIGQLLAAIEASEDTFLREGQEYRGPAAAQFLVAKLANQRGAPPTVEEFVATIASQSSRTAEPYRVRRKDGTVVTMRDWLTAELDQLIATEAPGRR